MEALLSGIQTAAVFILILAVLIFFHELGHFGAAKLFKMRVEEFALGFGKRLIRVGHDGETEYNIRVFPLGGFVRIAGMEIEDAVESRLTGGSDRRDDDVETETTNVALLKQSAAEVDGHNSGPVAAAPETDPNGFNSRPLYQRFITILAGPIFSLILGWLGFCLIYALYGVPGDQPLNRVAHVVPGEVAERAGLQAGDVIIRINETPIADGETMIQQIHASPGQPLHLQVQRGEGAEAVQQELVVTPREGEIAGRTVGLIGIVPEVPMERAGIGEAFAAGTRLTGHWFTQVGEIFKTGQFRQNLGGPVRIVQETQGAVQAGGPVPLLLLAQLSLSIGLFNLLPIPVLDGGHLVLLTLEGVRGRKLTGEQTQRVLTTGLAILAFLFVWVMFNDVRRFF